MKKSRELKKKLLEQLKQQNLPQNLLTNINTSLQEMLEQVEMETRLEKNEQCEQNSIKKITLWAKITDRGDGSAVNEYYLTEQEAQDAREEEFAQHGSTGFAEDCIEPVETYENSKIHKEAIDNRLKPWEMTEEKAQKNKKSFFQRQG